MVGGGHNWGMVIFIDRIKWCYGWWLTSILSLESVGGSLLYTHKCGPPMQAVKTEWNEMMQSYMQTFHEVAIPPAAVQVKIIYPAAGWITSYWPGKEDKYDHDVSWHTVASEWDLI